jgi:hypothetical protein
VCKLRFPLAPFSWWSVSFCALCAVQLVAVAVWGAKKRAHRVRRYLLYNGFCASCAYDLDGASAGRRGPFRCPECGACWTLDEYWRRPRTVLRPRPPILMPSVPRTRYR